MCSWWDLLGFCWVLLNPNRDISPKTNFFQSEPIRCQAASKRKAQRKSCNSNTNSTNRQTSKRSMSSSGSCQVPETAAKGWEVRRKDRELLVLSTIKHFWKGLFWCFSWGSRAGKGRTRWFWRASCRLKLVERTKILHWGSCETVFQTFSLSSFLYRFLNVFDTAF